MGLLVVLWLGSANFNHEWVIRERVKRVNWYGLFMQSSIVLCALCAFELAHVLVYVAEGHVVAPQPRWTLLAVSYGVAMGVAVALDLTRRFVPRDELPEPDPPAREAVRGGEPFRYAETEVDWWDAVCAAGALAFSALPALYSAVIPLRMVMAIGGIGVIAAALLASSARRTVVVTNGAIALRAGIIRKRISLSDVLSCRPIHHEMLSRRPRNVKRGQWSVWCPNDGRCLEITTRDGKVYLFGMVRPSYAAGLIESAINVKR